MQTLDELLSSTQTTNPELKTNPARRPDRIIIPGSYVKLVPLEPAAHSKDLYASTHGPGAEELWRYLWDGPFASEAEFCAALERKAASDDPLCFAIAHSTSGRALGYASYMRIEPANRSIEVGGILFAPELQRTRAATEAMYLMARHIFEELGYRRYEWKCDSLNRPSIRAALRLGFTFEGRFRQHMIVKGRNRDTAWLAMLDSEWPARKTAFERWLAPENFDAQGRQKSALGRVG
jgi:RimJ/RimL family protein N-acetyltransferase